MIRFISVMKYSKSPLHDDIFNHYFTPQYVLYNLMHYTYYTVSLT